MNRRTFFKFLGLTTVGVVAAPVVAKTASASLFGWYHRWREKRAAFAFFDKCCNNWIRKTIREESFCRKMFPPVYDEIKFVDISLVKDPVDPLCRIKRI